MTHLNLDHLLDWDGGDDKVKTGGGWVRGLSLRNLICQDNLRLVRFETVINHTNSLTYLEKFSSSKTKLFNK